MKAVLVMPTLRSHRAKKLGLTVASRPSKRKAYCQDPEAARGPQLSRLLMHLSQDMAVYDEFRCFRITVA